MIDSLSSQTAKQPNLASNFSQTPVTSLPLVSLHFNSTPTTGKTTCVGRIKSSSKSSTPYSVPLESSTTHTTRSFTRKFKRYCSPYFRTKMMGPPVCFCFSTFFGFGCTERVETFLSGADQLHTRLSCFRRSLPLLRHSIPS